MKTIPEAIRNPLLCLPEAQIPVCGRGRPALEMACGFRGGGIRGQRQTAAAASGADSPLETRWRRAGGERRPDPARGASVDRVAAALGSGRRPKEAPWRTARGRRRHRRWWHEQADGGARARRRQRERWVAEGGARMRAAEAVLTELWVVCGERKRGGEERGTV
jgi:hypothetical protein